MFSEQRKLIFCRRHYKIKFDIDPGVTFLRLLLQFHFRKLNTIRESKKTSLTSLCGTRYTVYGADFFFISTVCNMQRRKKYCDVP